MQVSADKCCDRVFKKHQVVVKLLQDVTPTNGMMRPLSVLPDLSTIEEVQTVDSISLKVEGKAGSNEDKKEKVNEFEEEGNSSVDLYEDDEEKEYEYMTMHWNEFKEHG